MSNDRRFAVLIDADNVSDKYIKFIFDEIAIDGTATYKRIYGDWTKPALANWKSVLLTNSITPIQQYGYTTGKNATDSAMIIDAMDILYSGNVEGFCLVSSDSDFTRLASRLRESGMYIVGMGERKTPTPFVSACNKFKYLDVLAQAKSAPAPAHTQKKQVQPQPKRKLQQEPPAPTPAPSTPPAEPASEMTSLETIEEAILSYIRENTEDEEDWVFISDLANMLNRRYPDFDVRNFGFSKLTLFIKSLGSVDVKSVQAQSSNNKLVYVREHKKN